ncbi:MAG: protein O-mannosyl-transferase family [Elusimicrobiota bacterium]
MDLSFDKNKRLVLGAVFLIFTVIYLITVCPTVPPYRDSGELITAAQTLSIAHSPGYPLYMIVGKFFITAGDLLGLSPALSMNLLSAVATAAAVTLLFYIIYFLTGSMASAILGSFLTGLSYVVWLLAVVSEMYALNLLMVVFLIYLFLKKKYLLGSFVLGLTLGNHLTAVFAALPLLFYAVKSTEFKRINVWRIIIFFGLGISVYLYLPIRALAEPFINWGDPSDISGVISVITREGYGHTLDLVSKEVTLGQVLGPQLWIFFKALVRDLTPAGIFLALTAVYLGFKKKKQKKTVILFSAIFLLTGPLFIYMAKMPVNPHARAIVEVGYILPEMALLVLAAVGLKLLIKDPDRPAIFLIIGAIIIFRFLSTHPKVDKSDNYLARNYAIDILTAVEDKSAVFLRKDHTLFAMWYMNFVEEYRPEVKVISKGLISAKWYREKLRKEYPNLYWSEDYYSDESYIDTFINRNSEQLNIYLTPAAAMELDGKFYEKWDIKPYGLVSKILLQNEKYDPKTVIKKNRAIIEKSETYNTEKYYDFFSRDIIKNYAIFYSRLGREFLNRKKTERLKKLYNYRYWYEKAMETAPEFPDPYIDLAYGFYRQNNLNEASRLYEEGTAKLEAKMEQYTRKSAFHGRLAESYNNLGSVYEKKYRQDGQEKNFKLALESYNLALKYRPNFSRVYYNKGVLFWNRDWQKSARNFKKVLEYNPENNKARNFYRRAIKNLPKQK